MRDSHIDYLPPHISALVGLEVRLTLDKLPFLNISHGNDFPPCVLTLIPTACITVGYNDHSPMWNLMMHFPNSGLLNKLAVFAYTLRTSHLYVHQGDL
jgi:hypothetical protein